MFWQVKANVLEREKQDVKKGKPGLYGLQKGRKKKKLADKQGVCYE